MKPLGQARMDDKSMQMEDDDQMALRGPGGVQSFIDIEADELEYPRSQLGGHRAITNR